MTRRRTFVALAVVGLIALGVLAAFLIRDGDDEAAFATLSAQERPFEMPVPASLGLPSSPKTTGQAFLLAEKDGIRFVRLPREDGSSCWGTSERRANEWFYVKSANDKMVDLTGTYGAMGQQSTVPEMQALAQYAQLLLPPPDAEALQRCR